MINMGKDIEKEEVLKEEKQEQKVKLTLEQHDKIYNYIYGIGGRDIGVDDIEEIFEDISKNTDNNEKIRYVGLK